MLTIYRFAARLQKLESQADDSPTGEGLCALLACARRHGLDADRVRLKDLTRPELDATIAALKPHGLSALLREVLEAEWTRRGASLGGNVP